MELAFLPGEKATKRTYKHYTINSSPAAIATEVAKLEFFYIGRKASAIDSLIAAFESGYAAESTVSAKSMLKRLLSHSKNAFIPDVIIMEASAGTEAIREMHHFLVAQPAFAAVPFVVEVSDMDTDGIDKLKNNRLIDDMMVVSDHNRASLIRKVNFLKKVKSAIFNDAGDRAVETSLREVSDKTAFVKRGFDIVISSSLLLALSPILLMVVVAIRLESKGPVFYIAKRAGRGYRIFNFFKFRTMSVGADQKIKEMAHLNQYNTTGEGPVFIKIDNDPRITRVGNFLRKTSLDELPQLANVLIGDMSLVGNRPLPLYEAASLTTDEWSKRFMAPAGMTGLWQIKKRGKKEMSIEERISLDIDYADRYSFLYDLWIMANTPSALIQKTNA